MGVRLLHTAYMSVRYLASVHTYPNIIAQDSSGAVQLRVGEPQSSNMAGVGTGTMTSVCARRCRILWRALTSVVQIWSTQSK